MRKMIQEATMTDAAIMVDLMHNAFEEYRNTDYSSSALDETMNTVIEGFSNGTKSLILYNEYQEAVAMVRYTTSHGFLHFFRLAVKQTAQGKGYSKQLLYVLEKIAHAHKLPFLTCEVRSNVPRNVQLYTKIGYEEVESKVVKQTAEANIKILTMVKKLIDA